MVEKLDIYKCQPCEIIVEALTKGESELVCCDKPMENLIFKTGQIVCFGNRKSLGQDGFSNMVEKVVSIREKVGNL
jgi:desulfoferrodoxin-like iron-binding protein